MKWSPFLIIFGSILMIIGALDMMEGSLLILPASGIVLLGTFLNKNQRSLFRYWVWIFILIAVGVAALWGWSFVGGFGGPDGRSWWWGLTVLPYPIGWIMGFANMISRFVEFLKTIRKRPQS